jgi:V8-like Glu-specific endopeptidase
MSDDSYNENLLRRANRAFGVNTISQIWSTRRAIVGPTRWPAGEQFEEAEKGKDVLQQGREPTPAQLAALEVAIRLLRPAPFTSNGILRALPQDSREIFTSWNDFRDLLKPFAFSIGRLDSNGDGPGGTGFLVGDAIVATNRHVLDFLSRGTRKLALGQATIQFRGEWDTVDEDPVGVVGVRAYHTEHDLALLDIEPDRVAGRPILPLEENAVEEQTDVVAVGYPMDDPVRNPFFITAVFGAAFGVKRGAPGEVIRVRPQEISHDCSTLGGNSGSPLWSMRSGRVVGIHSSGSFAYRNSAVPAPELAEFIQKNI